MEYIINIFSLSINRMTRKIIFDRVVKISEESEKLKEAFGLVYYAQQSIFWILPNVKCHKKREEDCERVSS